MTFRITSGDTITGKARSTIFNNLSEATSKNGVFNGLATTASGSPDWNANVALGVWRAGGVVCGKTGSTALAITNSSALTVGQTRFDLITADNANTLAVVTGTASTIPQFPALPASKIAVALVKVVYGQANIQASDITDMRSNINPEMTFYSADQTGSSTTSGSYVALKSYSITAAESWADYIIVDAQGVAEVAQDGSAGYFRATTGTTPGTLIGGEITVYGAGLSGVYGGATLHAVLIAGTHYTKGTAFTLNIEGRQTGGSVTVRYHSSSVMGVFS